MESSSPCVTVDEALEILVEAVKRELDEEPDDRIQVLAGRFRLLKEHNKALDDLMKLYSKAIGTAEKALLQSMIDNELPKFTSAGKSYSISSVKIHANLSAVSKEPFIQALTEHGFSHIAPRTINSKTLDSFTKEQLESNGGELPKWMDKYITFYKFHSINMKTT